MSGERMELARRNRDSSKSRQDILHAAEIEFASKGFYGARIDTIALNAQINKRMIYEYFGNKEELYKQVLTTVYGRIRPREEKLLSENRSAAEIITDYINLYFDFLQQNPTYVNLILWENLNRGRYIQQTDVTGIKAPVFERLRDIIEQGKQKGEFSKNVDTDQVILSILTYTFSYFSNRYTLSKLLGMKLDDEDSIRKRRENVTLMIMGYLYSNSYNLK
jgi:TetR/AcrR family transcriptional regulator